MLLGAGACRHMGALRPALVRLRMCTHMHSTSLHVMLFCLGMQVRGLEAASAVGGIKWVYPAARLLAAALWRARLADDPLDPAAGRRLRVGLLEAGAGLPGALLAARLLEQPGALVAVGGGGGGGERGSSSGVGWAPDLGADVWQELELLG